jgi:hypothetical protein
LICTCSWAPHLKLCCSSISRWWGDLRCPPTGAWGSTKAGTPLVDENIYAAAATHVATSQHTEQSDFDAGQLRKALTLCCSIINNSNFVVCHRRWGYRTLGAVADVVEKYKAADIPLEVIWTDIDYMVRTSNTMRYISCYCCRFR